MTQGIVGQTGKVVFSLESLKYKATKGRTVRYMCSKLGCKTWYAWVCGPFHSRLYGAGGCGVTKARATQALQRRLADSYGYHGRMMLSVIDTADTVGIVDNRLLDCNATNHLSV